MSARLIEKRQDGITVVEVTMRVEVDPAWQGTNTPVSELEERVLSAIDAYGAGIEVVRDAPDEAREHETLVAEVLHSCARELRKTMGANAFEAFWLADLTAKWDTRAYNLERGAA